jgi:probable F420-dependent oxidoreductase
VGPAATAQSVVRVAQRVEALGYDGVWVTDRLLFPLNPRTPYPATPDGSLPEPYQRVLDPLETLTFVAGHTQRVGLGTSVLDMPFYNPVVLARRLTTLDVLSGGRLRVGFGQGWSRDEYEAAGFTPRGLGPRADEFLGVLKAIWTTDPVEFHGRHFQVPKSIIQPKPVQRPHPPVYLAAFSPGALKRVATMANGWNPAGIPVAGMKQMMDGVREMARTVGRDPSTLELVVRANLWLTSEPQGNDRGIFAGAPAQIQADIEAVRNLGASELFFDATFSPGMRTEADFLKVAEDIRRLV